MRDHHQDPFFEQSLEDAQAIPPDVETLPLFLELLPMFHLRLLNKWIFIKARFSSSGIHGRWAYYPEAPLFFRRIDI